MKFGAGGIVSVAVGCAFAIVGVGCSTQVTEFSTPASHLKAIRINGGDIGDFDVPASVMSDEDSTAEGSTAASAGGDAEALPGATEGSDGSSAQTQSGSGSASSSPSGSSTTTSSSTSSSTSTSSSKAMTCVQRLQSSVPMTALRSVEINESNVNRNNQVLFEDPPSEQAQLVMLKVTLKNVNASTIKLLNPKSTYCVEMQVKNMNGFKFNMACQAKVGFVKVESKNANNVTTSVLPVKCD